MSAIVNVKPKLFNLRQILIEKQINCLSGSCRVCLSNSQLMFQPKNQSVFSKFKIKLCKNLRLNITSISICESRQLDIKKSDGNLQNFSRCNATNPNLRCTNTQNQSFIFTHFCIAIQIKKELNKVSALIYYVG